MISGSETRNSNSFFPIYISWLENKIAQLVISSTIQAYTRPLNTQWALKHQVSFGTYRIFSGLYPSLLIRIHDSRSGILMVCYNFSSHDGVISHIGKTFWKFSIPEKAKLFFWLYYYDRILMKENLIKRGVNIVGRYPLCDEQGEPWTISCYSVNSLKHTGPLFHPILTFPSCLDLSLKFGTPGGTFKPSKLDFLLLKVCSLLQRGVSEKNVMVEFFNLKPPRHRGR